MAVTDTILQLIKYAAESGERSLPGLNCMSPGTDLYRALDAFNGPTPDYYAIDANFVPPPILSHLFNVEADAASVGDKLMDMVFDHRPNDVAVPSIGVGDPGDADVEPPPAGGVPPAQAVPGFPVPAERHQPYPDGSVWHCSYFNRQETADRILEWLGAPPV
jgi:hypothetical protein